MNLFEQASQLKADKESKARKSSQASSPDTLTVPYFKGIVRKGDRYSVNLMPKVYEHEGIIEYVEPVSIAVKPLTGSFLISYFTCLAYQLCKRNMKGKKADPQPLTTFVVEALLRIEGFSLDDYAQGKTKGSVRIASHLKAISEQRGMKIAVDAKTGEIKGITDDIACQVLNAI